MQKTTSMETIDRTKIDWDSIRKLPTINDDLDRKYGKRGTPSRIKFDERSRAYCMGQILEAERREAKMTQTELAEKIGSNKSYISRVESGKTEPKYTTFLRILDALNLSMRLEHR